MEQQTDEFKRNDSRKNDDTYYNGMKVINAGPIVKGQISLDNLPEPYLLLSDQAVGHPHNFARALNILATEKGYEVVGYAVSSDSHYTVMKKSSK